MESAFTLLPGHCGSRPEEQPSFESFGGFSPMHGPRPSWTPLCLRLRSPGLTKTPGTEEMLCPSFFLLSMHGQSKREVEKLTISWRVKTSAVLKIIRKTKAQTLSQYQLAQWQWQKQPHWCNLCQELFQPLSYEERLELPKKFSNCCSLCSSVCPFPFPPTT